MILRCIKIFRDYKEHTPASRLSQPIGFPKEITSWILHCSEEVLHQSLLVAFINGFFGILKILYFFLHFFCLTLNFSKSQSYCLPMELIYFMNKHQKIRIVYLILPINHFSALAFVGDVIVEIIITMGSRKDSEFER